MGYIVGEYQHKERLRVNESYIALKLLEEKVKNNGLLIDVGAEMGSVTALFAENGWGVIAFEPDMDSYSELCKRTKMFDNVKLYNCAVSDTSNQEVNFYASEESRGINSLYPFTEGHKLKATVKTRTLSEVLRELSITQVDFLKIDTEGFDFLVLQGMDWEVSPQMILCEYEDKKTIPLGYVTEDMANYLVDKGYQVFVSQWHPIIKYGIGGGHGFRCLEEYPCDIPSDSWGNLIASKEIISVERIKSIYTAHINNLKSSISADEALAAFDKQYYKKNRTLSSFFKERSLKKIAVYGVGVFGKIIIDDLSKDTDITLTLIDKRLAGQQYNGMDIVSLANFNMEVDAIFISLTHSIEEIKADILHVLNCKQIFTMREFMKG